MNKSFGRYSLDLLYWYKSTSTDNLIESEEVAQSDEQSLPTYALRVLTYASANACARQVHPVYLLYWYKSTNTDADHQEEVAKCE